MIKRDIITGRPILVQKFINLFSKKLRLRLNPRRYAIELFMNKSSKQIKKGSLILDAGAGPCPYKSLFSHAKYQATDFNDSYKMMDFTCNLNKIPKASKSYEGIICTEVLEHVQSPQSVINEFYRILKNNGKLFLTTPQQYLMHQKPYNFFYFTYYGLESLLKNAGFKKYSIKPMGGFFWALADMIKFNSLLDKKKTGSTIYYLLKIIEFPITQIILPLILFHLDFMDYNRDWTMGWTLEATK